MARASDSNSWDTSITSIEPDHIRYRGYSVEDLMGRVPYANTLYLLLVGELPGAGVARMLDAILVSSMDHGTTPPSTLAARTAASTGAPLNAALAAGLLSINEYHGGAIEACMRQLSDIAAAEDGARGRDEAARTVVDQAIAQKKRLSGFGHRVHRNDPRATRLFEIASEEGLKGEWVARVLTLEIVLAQATGKRLPVNVDGAIAALLLEMQIPSDLANALFMVARMPGLLAQIAEERTSQRPMRRIVPGQEHYAGPAPRTPEGHGGKR